MLTVIYIFIISYVTIYESSFLYEDQQLLTMNSNSPKIFKATGQKDAHSFYLPMHIMSNYEVVYKEGANTANIIIPEKRL